MDGRPLELHVVFYRMNQVLFSRVMYCVLFLGRLQSIFPLKPNFSSPPKKGCNCVVSYFFEIKEAKVSFLIIGLTFCMYLETPMMALTHDQKNFFPRKLFFFYNSKKL